MGGTGGKGGKGGSGGKWGNGGGNAARKRKMASETPQQQTARCEKRSERCRAILGVQGATQRLNHVIYGTPEAEESALAQEKGELDSFCDAVVKAGGVLGQQGKLLAVQNQWSRLAQWKSAVRLTTTTCANCTRILSANVR